VAGCPACGKEVPGEFPFCPFCGAALAGPAQEAAKERKVVSVLFCDLVGFTGASEAADPEEVQARLAPYHAHVRARIETFGGTVEKFIGDAVMAVFGAPVAHEDDAERAVRAGLAILETIDQLNAADPALSLPPPPGYRLPPRSTESRSATAVAECWSGPTRCSATVAASRAAVTRPQTAWSASPVRRSTRSEHGPPSPNATP
jgi:Adenylate and Guanylate cyclase catalytic domain